MMVAYLVRRAPNREAARREQGSAIALGIPQRLPPNAILNLGVARHVIPVLSELKIVKLLGDIVRRGGADSALRSLAPVALACALARIRV
jgi:hypothetical protein